MIWHIVHKELLDNLLSLRFMLSMVLVILLFATSGFFFVSVFREQSREYWAVTNRNLSSLDEQTHQLKNLAFHQQQILRRPKPLTLCVEGHETSLPNRIRFDIFTIELPERQGSGNFTLPYFSRIDWAFIISGILSFVVFVLSFDSICGEREVGTLRLMLAGSVPRHTVLLAKYLGLMLTVCIPLLIGVLVSLVIVLIANVAAIREQDWLKILAIVGLSLLYLSIILLLGLTVSSRTRQSAHSMVILLLVWVVLIILIPSLGRSISYKFGSAPTRIALQRKLAEVKQEIWDDPERFGTNAGVSYPDANDPRMNLPARARLFNAVSDAENRVVEDHHNRLMRQALIGRRFSLLSPAATYQQACEALAGVGIHRSVRLFEQVKEYAATLKQFIRSRDADDPGSRHLIFNEDNSMGEFDWRTISRSPVPFDSVPRFNERDRNARASLQAAAGKIALLILLNAAFAATAFISFVRYDVR